MDLGFEGGFICHNKSIPKEYVSSVEEKDSNWVWVKPTRFGLCFANDILEDARKAWLKYFRRYGYESEIYHSESIVDLVKQHNFGAKVFPDNVDVVIGGFPCQDFSVAGKRMGFESSKDHYGNFRDKGVPSEETRGKLYFWMKQVIDIVKPKIFIAENVKGLVNLGDVKKIIQHDFSQAADGGYIVLEPQVLHAANYGVPESRERIIFIGIKKSELNSEALKALSQKNIPQDYNPYPFPTHNYNLNNDKLLPVVTCRDVFYGLREPELSCDQSQKVFSKAKYLGSSSQGQTEIKLDNIGPTIRSEHHGNIEFRRLLAEHGGKYFDELNAGMKERRLTPRECALIQTFPPDYPFIWTMDYSGKKVSLSSSGAYKIIGNAVPPVFAYNIAMRIQSLWSTYFTK